MIWVADSSAVVKLYADEDGSELVAAQEGLVVSAVTRVEVAAALWRKVSTGELSTSDAAILSEELSADWAGEDGNGPRFTVVALAAVVLDAAADLVPVHRLRAYDAIVLATALAVRALEPEIGLIAWDRQLRDAAHREGLAVAPEPALLTADARIARSGAAAECEIITVVPAEEETLPTKPRSTDEPGLSVRRL